MKLDVCCPAIFCTFVIVVYFLYLDSPAQRFDPSSKLESCGREGASTKGKIKPVKLLASFMDMEQQKHLLPNPEVIFFKKTCGTLFGGRGGEVCQFKSTLTYVLPQLINLYICRARRIMTSREGERRRAVVKLPRAREKEREEDTICSVVHNIFSRDVI